MDLKGQGLALAPSQGKLAICPLDGVGRDPGVIDGPSCNHSLKGPDLSGFVLKYIGSYRKYAMAKFFLQELLSSVMSFAQLTSRTILTL